MKKSWIKSCVPWESMEDIFNYFFAWREFWVCAHQLHMNLTFCTNDAFLCFPGVKFYCRNCGDEGHRRHYCPTLWQYSNKLQFKCRLCGEKGHNRRTCGKSKLEREQKRRNQIISRHCTLCGQNGHNRRTCPKSTETEAVRSNTQEGT